MRKYELFIRKHNIPLSIASFVFIGLPQWIEALWSLSDRIKQNGESVMNLTWLYGITAPLGLFMLGFIIWQSRKFAVNYSLEDALTLINQINNLAASLYGLSDRQSAKIRTQINNEIRMCPNKWMRQQITAFRDAVVEAAALGICATDNEAQTLSDELVSRLSEYAYTHFQPNQKEGINDL